MISMEESDADFAAKVSRELARARKKFPTCSLSTIALMEEVGELAQALLKWRAGKGHWHQVETEAAQVACMAQRIVTEGDDSLLAVPCSEGTGGDG